MNMGYVLVILCITMPVIVMYLFHQQKMAELQLGLGGTDSEVESLEARVAELEAEQELQVRRIENLETVITGRYDVELMAPLSEPEEEADEAAVERMARQVGL